MQTVNKFRAQCLAAIAACLGLTASAQATVVTFDNATQLTSNFNLDVFSGDYGTQWSGGYSAAGSYVGSSGGFVHLNYYDSPNSLQFKAGPVFLNGFTISSQYGGNGAGVNSAAQTQGAYLLELYGASNQLLSSRTLQVGEHGNWDYVSLDVAGVQSMRILARWSAPGVYNGWWPNVDNITYNEPAAGRADVPEPGALSLVAAALGGVALTRRRRQTA